MVVSKLVGSCQHWAGARMFGDFPGTVGASLRIAGHVPFSIYFATQT